MPIDQAEFAQALLETRNQRSPRGGRACAQETDDIDWLLRSCNRLGRAMKDYQTRLEKLRADAAECALIRDLATDPAKRELFDRLAVHLSALANQVEEAMLHGRPGKAQGE